MPAEARPHVERYLKDLDSYLEPAPPQWLLGRVAGMLAHFFVPNMPQALQEAVLTDWVDALERYPRWAIELAIKTWLATSPRKPAISDITAECRALVNGAVVDRELTRRLLAAQE